jgi:hypothetical protein
VASAIAWIAPWNTLSEDRQEPKQVFRCGRLYLFVKPITDVLCQDAHHFHCGGDHPLVELFQEERHRGQSSLEVFETPFLEDPIPCDYESGGVGRVDLADDDSALDVFVGVLDEASEEWHE